MAWEVFSRKVIRTDNPNVTVTTMGRMAFNKSATTYFEKEKVTHVLAMWNSDKSLCGVKSIVEPEPRAYKLSFGVKGNGAGFSAVTFLNHIKYDWATTRSFPLNWDDASSMFSFRIPAEFIGKVSGDRKAPIGKHRTIAGDVEEGEQDQLFVDPNEKEPAEAGS